MTQLSPQSTALPRLRTFARREDGSLIIFTLFMFVLMLMIAGISLDVERFETVRTKIQATSDGAALSAASLSQNADAADVVQSYFDASGLGAFLRDVHVAEEPGSKVVTVETGLNVPTHFMNMIGVNNLAVPVSSVAGEAVSDIEISMVLDISGSMGSNAKLTNLKTAGKEFIDTVYEHAEPNTVSTSIVPYSTQVSIGADVLKHLAPLDDAHVHSSCVNFDAEDYASTTIDLASAYEQTLHFDARTTWWDPAVGLNLTECNDEAWTEAIIHSQNTDTLKAHIDAYKATDWTSIELGAKWGTALLDPSFQPAVTGLIADGIVNEAFAGRPAAMNDEETMKVLVIMTDGVNTNQHRVLPAYRNDQRSRVYVHYDALGRPYYNVYTGSGYKTKDASGETGTDLWYLVNDYNGGADVGFYEAPFGGTLVNLSYNELWANMPVRHYVDTILPVIGTVNPGALAGFNAMVQAKGQSDKNAHLEQVCNAAKAQGITIYTVGFEAPAMSETILQQCATTPSHFFDVEGAEISQAFFAIAADINRLRLMY